MRLYLNTSALNRPFDDQSSLRVRTEAEAVVALLETIEDGRAELATSEYALFEVSQSPDVERVLRLRSILRLARISVRVSDSVARRARDLERFGLRGLDALHVAAAEAARANVLVTSDDRMLRRCARAASHLSLEVMGPTAALALLTMEQRQ